MKSPQTISLKNSKAQMATVSCRLSRLSAGVQGGWYITHTVKLSSASQTRSSQTNSFWNGEWPAGEILPNKYHYPFSPPLCLRLMKDRVTWWSKIFQGDCFPRPLPNSQSCKPGPYLHFNIVLQCYGLINNII